MFILNWKFAHVISYLCLYKKIDKIYIHVCIMIIQRVCKNCESPWLIHQNRTAQYYNFIAYTFHEAKSYTDIDPNRHSQYANLLIATDRIYRRLRTMFDIRSEKSPTPTPIDTHVHKHTDRNAKVRCFVNRKTGHQHLWIMDGLIMRQSNLWLEIVVYDSTAYYTFAWHVVCNRPLSFTLCHTYTVVS